MEFINLERYSPPHSWYPLLLKKTLANILWFIFLVFFLFLDSFFCSCWEEKKFKFYAKIFLPFQHQIGRWTCHLVKRFSIQRTHRIYFQVIVDANMTKCMSTGCIDWLNKWLETYLAHQIFVHFTWNKIVFIRINFFTYSLDLCSGLVWTNF